MGRAARAMTPEARKQRVLTIFTTASAWTSFSPVSSRGTRDARPKEGSRARLPQQVKENSGIPSGEFDLFCLPMV